MAKVGWHQVHKLMKLSIRQETLPTGPTKSNAWLQVTELQVAVPASHGYGWCFGIGKIIAQMHAVHVETQLQLKSLKPTKAVPRKSSLVVSRLENALIEIVGLAKCLQLLPAWLPKLTLSMAWQMRYLFNARLSSFSIVQLLSYPNKVGYAKQD